MDWCWWFGFSKGVFVGTVIAAAVAMYAIRKYGKRGRTRTCDDRNQNPAP